MSQSPFASSIWLEAGQSVFGSLLSWSVACSFAGFLVEVVVAPDWADWTWWWSLAWIGHLITAGAAIWGLIPFFLHVGCVTSLIQGSEPTSATLRKAFLIQITTSSLAVSLLTEGAARKMLWLWLAVGPAVIASLRRRRSTRRQTACLCPERASVLLKAAPEIRSGSDQSWPPAEPPPTRPSAR